MKKTILYLLLVFLIAQTAKTQTTPDSTVVHGLRELTTDPDAYTPTNHTGIANTKTAELITEANKLRDLVKDVAPGFKVFDYGSYPMLTQMGKEADITSLFAAMEAKIAAMTPAVPNYLLIGKHIDSETGKVSFKVRLSLPMTTSPTGNKGSSGGGFYPATLVWKWKDATLSAIEDYLYTDPNYGHYEAHEKNGIIRLIKMISDGEYLSDGNWYRPDGYPINNPQTKTGHFIDYIIHPQNFIQNAKNGFVYGWRFLDKDNDGKTKFDEIYKAVIEDNKFYGYYLDGIIDKTNLTKNRYQDDGNTNKSEPIQVKAVDYITEKCGGIEWYSTSYKQIATEYPPYPTNLKSSISDNSNLPAGYGYQSQTATKIQVFYECSTGEADTYERYFIFKLHKNNNTQKTRETLQKFCLLLADKKIDAKILFKSQALVYYDKYVYFKFENNKMNAHIIDEKEGPTVQYLSFIEQVFLPTDPNSWDDKIFETASKTINEYYNNLSEDIDRGECKHVEIKIAGGLFSAQTAYLFIAAEKMATQRKMKYFDHDIGVIQLINKEVYNCAYAKPILLCTHDGSIPSLIFAIGNSKNFWKTITKAISNGGSTASSFTTSDEDRLVIGQFLTSQKIRLTANNLVSNVKPVFEVPFNVMDILAGTEVTNFDLDKLHYNIKFNQAYWIETECVIEYLPFTGGYHKNDTAWVTTNQILDNGGNLGPLDLILLRASNEKYKSNGDQSLYAQFKMGEDVDFYLVSPFLIDIEHKLDNSKRAAAYVEAAVTAISVVALVPEIQAARLAYIEGQFLKFGVKSAYALLDASVLVVNFADIGLTNDQKQFINNSYLMITFFRIGGNLAFNKYLKSEAGQTMLTNYFGKCDDLTKGAEGLTKRIARRMLSEYGHLRPGACFTAGTLIKAEPTSVIEKIKENDMVWSWDFEKKALTLQRVVRTFKRCTDKLVHLFIGKEIIHTTPEHPFYVPQQEQIYASTENNNIEWSEKGAWVLAKNLKKGAKVFLFSTLLATVDSTYTQDTTCTVYNFEVENTHNYFVGRDAVLVHNTCFEEIKAIVNANKEASALTKSRLLELVEHNPNLSYRLLPVQNGIFNQKLFDDMMEAISQGKLYEKVAEVNKVIKNNFKLIEDAVDDPNVIIGYRGSLTKGTSYNSGNPIPFNPNKYDVDGFIVSDKLAAKFEQLNIPKSKWFVNENISKQITNYQDMMEFQFKNIQGYGKPGQPFSFKVFTQSDFAAEAFKQQGYKIFN